MMSSTKARQRLCGTSWLLFFFLMIRRPPRSTLSSSSAASDVYKRQVVYHPLHLQYIH
ncbi:hypothetical protein CDFC105_93919 [Clostridioides difficile]|nr:hypothetical protein CDFC105_93919 [Clostridioides difficile]